MERFPATAQCAKSCISPHGGDEGEGGASGSGNEPMSRLHDQRQGLVGENQAITFFPLLLHSPHAFATAKDIAGQPGENLGR